MSDLRALVEEVREQVQTQQRLLPGAVCFDMSVTKLTALLDALAGAEKRGNELEAKLAAFIANVDEMHIGVGLPPMFTVLHEGKTYAVQPEVPKAWYKAIRDKWNADSEDLIRTCNEMAHNEFAAKERAASAEARLSKLQELGRQVVGVADALAVRLCDEHGFYIENADAEKLHAFKAEINKEGV